MPATLHTAHPVALLEEAPTFTIGAYANERGHTTDAYRRPITAPMCPVCAHGVVMQTTFEADNLIHICPLCNHIEFI